MTFTPHYVFWECLLGCDQRYLEKDCFGGGKYCAMEPSNEMITGREIVLEDVRQKCLYSSLSKRHQEDVWFEYISRVHSVCYSVINEDCSREAHKHLDLDWDQTVKCVEDSFSKPEDKWGLSSCTNSIIDAEIAYWQLYGMNTYPSIVINKKSYRGQIEPLSVFNALCADFEEPPQACYKTLHREAPNSAQMVFDQINDDNMVTVSEIVCLVLGLILLNVLCVYCCRRRAKREMRNAMNVQIESQVSQYFALSQTNKSVDTNSI